MITPRQIPLSLPHRAALDRADFLVGAANAADALDRSWPDPVAERLDGIRLRHDPTGMFRGVTARR